MKALGLSNRAAGSVTSQEFLVSPGLSYTPGAWFRSNMNQDGFGHWKLRVAYTDLNGNSVANVDVGTSSAPTSVWAYNSGVTVAPANAYKARVVVRALDVNGWVDVDDISMSATGVTPAVTTTLYYSLGGASVAFRQSTPGVADKVFFTVGDQVGGVSVTYRSDGGQTTSQRYRPFGAPRTTGGTNILPTDHSFIGQVADNSAGLMYLNHRYYDPALARFTSVDPLVGKTGEAYTYAGNNPITFSDPSGLCAADGNGAREACSRANGSSVDRSRSEDVFDPWNLLMQDPAASFAIPIWRGFGTTRLQFFIDDNKVCMNGVGVDIFCGHGDNRGFAKGEDVYDYDLPSRVRIVLDHETGVASIFIYVTHGPDGEVAPLPLKVFDDAVLELPIDFPSSVSIYRKGDGVDGNVVFSYRFLDPLIPALIGGVAPAIDGAIRIRQGPHNTVKVDGRIAQYPSLEIIRDERLGGVEYSNTIFQRRQSSGGPIHLYLPGTDFYVVG